MKNILLISIFFSSFLGCKEDKKIEKIEIYSLSDTVEQFDYSQLTAKIINNNNSIDTTAAITWHSNDTSIAKIDTKGMVKGIDTGAVIIKASIDNYSAKIILNVVENQLFKSNWMLTSIQDIHSMQSINFPESAPRKITITYSFGRIQSTDSIHSLFGFSGICNRGGGYCTIDGNKIFFSKQIHSTRIECYKYGEWEYYLIDNFREAYEFSIDANQLLIKSIHSYNLFFDKIP